ncbi:hypothetical protein FHETE_3937 [Fusarium heterosporum]|uniref:FAD-binding FR-type domain-containing protein n=1 Tax=Fusarium heterosporum TaxID=42747 RepID=A0A8H5WV39_FUSHE|nr:hypothetical protein FHETE_3937 [Fusarium heterosporum]
MSYSAEMSLASVNSDPSPLNKLKHRYSTRLTPSLSVHTFAVQANYNLNRSFAPSQHLTLQFPPDLDPVSGPQNLSEEDRRLSFTPYHVQYDNDGVIESVSLMARNGRVTGLLGLPRPHNALIAEIVQVAGGFPAAILDSTHRSTCIAGGTGIAPFIAMAAAKHHGGNAKSTLTKPALLWSIRGNDFGIVEYFLKHQIIHPGDWSVVRIFVTAGEEVDGLIDGKSSQWWHARFRNFSQGFDDECVFHLRRMDLQDLEPIIGDTENPVLFCGSKQLEWQVKMWLLTKRSVHCTER